MEITVIVNEEDEIIDYKERSTLRDEDIYRVSSLLIKNSAGKYLLAQRSFKKDLGPWVWSFSAAGWVEKWESYDENMKKEAEEEIGLVNTEMKSLFKKRVSILKKNFFCQYYLAKMDVNIDYFTIQEEEVEGLRWFTIEEIRAGEYEWNKFSENLMQNLEAFDAL